MKFAETVRKVKITLFGTNIIKAMKIIKLEQQ